VTVKEGSRSEFSLCIGLDCGADPLGIVFSAARDVLRGLIIVMAITASSANVIPEDRI
jgi:hypothetical protein